MKSLPIFTAYNSNKLQSSHKTITTTNRTSINNKPFFSPNISINNSLCKDKPQKTKDESQNKQLKTNIKYPTNLTYLSKPKEIPSKVYEICICKMFLYLKQKVPIDIYKDVYNTYIEELNREMYNITTSNSVNSNSMNTLPKGLKLSYEANTPLSEEDDDTFKLHKNSKIQKSNGNFMYNCNNNNITNNSKVKSYCNKSNNNVIKYINYNTNNNNNTNSTAISPHVQSINISSSTLHKHSLYALTKKGKNKYIQTTALSQNHSKSSSLERPQSFPKKNEKQNSNKHSLNKSKLSKHKSNRTTLNEKVFDKINREIGCNIRSNVNANINHLNFKGMNNKSTRNYHFNRTTTNSLKKSKNSNSKPKLNNNIHMNKKTKTFRQTLSQNHKNILANKENILTNSPKRKEKEIDDSNCESKKNSEQLLQIKSSLDDNLKVMFNFSYEGFLNKESESESKRSYDQQETHYNYAAKYCTNIISVHPQKTSLHSNIVF